MFNKNFLFPGTDRKTDKNTYSNDCEIRTDQVSQKMVKLRQLATVVSISGSIMKQKFLKFVLT